MGSIFHNSYIILGFVPISDFVDSSAQMLKHGYVAPRLKSSLQNFYGHHDKLVDRYKIFISQMKMELFPFMLIFSFLYH